MRGGGDIFVDHRIAAAPAVILIAHLFADAVAQPVGGPGLPFRDVAVQGGLQREETTSVGLLAGLDALFPAPFLEDGHEAFVQQLGLSELEVEAHAVHLLLELRAFLGPVLEVRDVAQTADFEHREREPRHEVVAAPLLEFLREVARPVVAFQLHAVHEEGTDVARERTGLGLDRVGHMVQVSPHRGRIHMVEDGAGGTGSPVDDTGEGIEADQGIDHMLPFRDIQGDDIIHEAVGNIHDLAEIVDGVRGQFHRNQLAGTARIGKRHTGIHHFVEVELRHLEEAAFHLLGPSQHHARPFIARKPLRAERPAGTNDQVAGHPQLLRFVEHDLEHGNPLIAQPGQGFLAQAVRFLPGEGNGVDLHAADAGILEQVQLAHKLFGLDFVTVPPPAHEGAVATVRILELLVQGVRARDAGGQFRGRRGAQVFRPGRQR